MPYVEPDRKAPETPSQTEQMNDFSGGLNTTISGSLLNKNEAQEATNVSFEQKGTIAPLKGRRKRYTEPYSTNPCTGLGMLFKQDGTSHLIMTAGDKVYSDAPRMSSRFTEKADWEKGTINPYASITREEGSVVVDAGTLGMLYNDVILTGFSPFSSVAGSTYGWKFKVDRTMQAFKLKWIPLLSGVEYTISIWEAWQNEGTTAYNRLTSFKKTPLPTEINTVQTAELVLAPLTTVVIQANKEYVISVHCPSANGVSRYLVSGTPVKPSYMTYMGSFSIAGDLYPTTDTTGSATFYGASLMLEYLHHEVTVNDTVGFATGTSVNLEYGNKDQIEMTHAVPTANCSLLANRLDRVIFDDFTLDSGVLNFLKTTITNSGNKTGLLYPYCSNFKVVAFPTSTAFVSNTELSNAEYLTIKDTGVATSFATGATAGQFSGIKTKFYVPVEIYDRDKTTELSFTFNIAPIDATTKILVYALPYGGVELGTSNAQVLVATIDPNVFRPYTVSIKADPKRFINPTTGEVNLYVTTDIVFKGFSVCAVKMNPTWIEKTTEQLRALLSVGYTTTYGDGNTEVKSISYMTANFGLAKFDKARTSITIGVQSNAYSKAILPSLKVCGKSGLSIVRKAMPVNYYVTDAKVSGTKTDITNVATGVALSRQGVDVSRSVVKTTGTKVQTVYDAGKDAVILSVDPGAQGISPLSGWSYAKKITIPETQVDASLAYFPLIVYLNSGNFDFTKAMANGSDIRFTDKNLNQLKFERKEHAAGTTNKATYNVQVPTVSDLTDTEIYMWYGNPNAYNASIEAWQEMTGKALTYNGNVKLVTGVQTGKRVASFDGSGDYFSLPNNIADFNFLHQVGTTGKWTAEFKYKANSFTGVQVLFHNNNGASLSHGMYLEIGVDRRITVYMTRGVSNSPVISFTTAEYFPNDYNMHDIEVTYDQSLATGNAKIFIDGVLLSSGNKAGTIPSTAIATREIIIGGGNGGSWVNGSISGIRFTKDRCRHTANFTPPTQFDIDGADVVFCTNFDTIYDDNYVMVQHMGDSLVDATGNGNNGVATGTTVVDTVYGKARNFNNNLITIPSLNLSATDKISILTMFRDSYKTAIQIIMEHSSNFNSNNSFLLTEDTTGVISFTSHTMPVSKYNGSGTTVDRTNSWNCYGVTSDRSLAFANENKLYANGVYDTLLGVSRDESSGVYGNFPLYIGRRGADNSTPAYMDMGEVRISNIARSDAWTKAESLGLKNSLVTIADATFYSYYGTGTFETAVLDFTGVIAPEIGTETLVKTLTIPSGTTASIEYKTSADNSAWSAYATLSTATLPWAKYMKFRVNFATDVTLKLTPEFKELTLAYKTGYFSEGYWTSDVVTLAMGGLTAESIGYTLDDLTPTGTATALQTRTSVDNITWTAWVNTTFATLPVANYLQYRVKLTPNTALTLSPIHKKSYVGYTVGFQSTGSWTSPVYDLTSYKQDTIEFEMAGAFADFIVLNPVTKITAWIKTSYNNDTWTAWQKFDFDNVAWDYSDLTMNPYIQLKIDYVSTNEMQTPIINSFTFREADDLKLAVWTSAPIDVSMAKTLNSGKVLAQYTNGGGSLALMSRTSPDGITGWSSWSNVDASYNIVSPPNNFVQIKALFYGYNSKLTELVLSMDGNASVKVLGTGLSLGTDYSFTVLRDKLIIANGKDPLKKWDGTTDTLLAVPNSPPTLKHVITHHNRVWGVDAENQSRVRYSNILDPEKWDAFDFIDFNPEDGDYILSILKYGQNVLVSKQRSMALLTGNKTSNYSVSWLESEQGCSSARGICQADKYVAYVAQDGVRFTDLANSIVATERVLPNWNMINKRRLSQSAIVYWRNKLFVALPTEESLVNNVVWVYDFLRNSWAIREGWSVSSWLKFNQYGEDILLAGSSETGQIHEVDVTDYDDAIPVAYKWKSKDFNFKAPERYKLFRNIFLDIAGTSDTTLLYVDLIVDGVITGTYTTEIPAGAGSKHSRRILPPLYGAVLGSTLTIQLRGRCAIQGITIEYVMRGAIPGGNM